MEKENLLKYHHTYTKVNDLYSLFDDAAPNELLRINDDLKDKVDDLFLTIAVDKKIKESVYRCLKWINYYLHKNSKYSCKHDVDNLFKDIFPKILKQLDKDNKIK